MANPGKILLVTGSPGVGKTTLITRVFESLKLANPSLKVQGFYTREVRREGERLGFEVVRREGERLGFEVVTLDGRTGLLASSTVSGSESMGWPCVGKYKIDVASFESIAMPEMQVRKDTDLFIIDEVGKMEMHCSSFFPAVLKVLESNIPVLASIPIPKHGKDIPGVARLKNHPNAAIYPISPSNRDIMREDICNVLLEALGK